MAGQPGAPRQWTKKIREKLGELTGDDGYFVHDVCPDKAQSLERYQFSSSTTAGLANQISLFLAMREYHESNRLSDCWDRFEKNFELCFPAGFGKSASFGDDVNPWGLPLDQRPKFNVLYPKDSASREDENNRILWLIEFWPNRAIKDESYILFGRLNDVIIQVMNITHTKEIVKNLSFTLGMPLTEHLKRSPKVGLTIQIILSNYSTPPFYKSRDRPDYIQHQISIPWANPEKIKNYTFLRDVCGANSGLDWGINRATAYMASNEDDFPVNKKGMPQLWCGGGTQSDATTNCKKFAQLSDAKIISLSCSEKNLGEGVEATRNQGVVTNRKYKVYPAYFFIENTRIVQETQQNASPSRRTLTGKLNKKNNKFPIWYRNAPPQWGKNIDDLTKWN